MGKRRSKPIVDGSRMLEMLHEFQIALRAPYLYGEGAELSDGFYLTFVTEQEVEKGKEGVSRRIDIEEMRELSRSKHCKNKEVVNRMFIFIDEMIKEGTI